MTGFISSSARAPSKRSSRLASTTRSTARRAPSMTSHFASAMETTAKLNADGFRVVAVAFKEMPPTQTSVFVADEADLTLLGYIAFLDPPKETAPPRWPR